MWFCGGRNGETAVCGESTGSLWFWGRSNGESVVLGKKQRGICGFVEEGVLGMKQSCLSGGKGRSCGFVEEGDCFSGC